MKTALFVAMAVLLLVVAALGGQASTLDSSEAEEFMGTWLITLDNTFATWQENLVIRDVSGKVAASVGVAGQDTSLNIQGIVKDGKSLVFTLERWENGQPIEAVMTVTRDGEMIGVVQTLEGSEFPHYGSGERQ